MPSLEDDTPVDNVLASNVVIGRSGLHQTMFSGLEISCRRRTHMVVACNSSKSLALSEGPSYGPPGEISFRAAERDRLAGCSQLSVGQ